MTGYYMYCCGAVVYTGVLLVTAVCVCWFLFFVSSFMNVLTCLIVFICDKWATQAWIIYK